MPKFSYTVKNKDGKAYKNVVDAVSQAALVEKLQKQGFFIVNIKPLGGTVVPKKPSVKSIKKTKKL